MMRLFPEHPRTDVNLPSTWPLETNILERGPNLDDLID